MAQVGLPGFGHIEEPAAQATPKRPTRNKSSKTDLDRLELKPGCFQGRRIAKYRGHWYVFPSEEPRVQGQGMGEITGLAAPRLEWQSSIKTSTGRPRKPRVIVPEATRKKDEPISHRDQLAKASVRSYDNKTRTMHAQPIVFGSGDLRRVYARPLLKVDGETVPDRGEAVRQLDGGPVYWQSLETFKDGTLAPPRTLDPLTNEQIAAIEFELWLAKHYPDPLARFRYLVRERDALVVVNHSGGKDSQAMYLHLTRDLGLPRKQIRVVHADLPGADWPGTLDHIKATTDEKVKVVTAQYSDGSVKELYDYVLKRKKFPSAAQRYCTSDLKTSPIDAWIRQAMCELNGLKKHCKVPANGQRIVISTLGMRAQESDNRAGLSEWEISVGDSVAGRLWFEYLPIFRWTEKQVFSSIERHRQAPFWIYGRTPQDCRRLVEAGSVDQHGHCVPMRRMSCVFCIMSSVRDIGVASLIGPQEIAEKICDTEVETGHTFKHKTTFPDLQLKGRAEVYAGTKKRLDVITTARKLSGPCQ